MTAINDPGEVPVLDWLDKAIVDVDPIYQRNLDEARVDRILSTFRWDSFGAIVVAPVEDGRYHCTDGQHRLEAAKRHPNITVVPAVIIAASGTRQEAENFVSINANRKNISALDRYWAELAAEEDEAKTIEMVVNRAGAQIMRYPGAEYEPGQTVAVSAIRSIVSKWGAMRARQAVEIGVKAGLAPIRGEHIRAAEILLTDDEFRHDVDPDALAESLSGQDEEFLVEAKAFAKTHRMNASRALASVWFRRTRKKRKVA